MDCPSLYLQVELRPNAFYELTNGCELVFADVRCQYYVGLPPNAAAPGDMEQTQAYFFEETDGGQEEHVST